VLLLFLIAVTFLCLTSLLGSMSNSVSYSTEEIRRSSESFNVPRRGKSHIIENEFQLSEMIEEGNTSAVVEKMISVIRRHFREERESQRVAKAKHRITEKLNDSINHSDKQRTWPRY
jgi:hypothetical protein